MKHPASSVAHSRTALVAGFQFQEIQDYSVLMKSPSVPFGLRKDAVFFSEPEVYKMLLRGHAPASEPFRKWVTEEVLPSIRKTGSYDIGASTTPEAQQLSMDYGGLRALIENMAI